MSQREGSSHLLYVDPDPAYRRKVASVFEPEWTVTAVESADEGRAVIEDGTDYIVVADELPAVGGLEFYLSVRDDIEETPFVLFAAEEDVDLLRRAFRADVTDVIYKQRSPGVSTDPESDSGSAGAESSNDDRRVNIGDGDQRTDISDGIVGLRNCLAGVEPDPADLDGITLDVSRSLMGAAADEIDMKTEWALQSLAEEIDANQCLIYEVDEGTLELTHGWSDESAAENDPHRSLFDIGSEKLPTDRFPGFGSQLQQFEPACVDVTALDDVAPESQASATAGGCEGTTVGGNSDGGVTTSNGESGTAAVEVDAEAIAANGEVGTMLALPVVIEWQLSGTIVITVDHPREWDESARQRLKAVGELVGHMERRRRQREELERQNEQLEQFASVISHDLQNPLNVISGYLDLAMETGNLDRLDPAADAAGRMEEMLDDLLTLAREGRAVGETQEVELKPIVSEAWDSVETYDGSLELEGLEELDPVMADDSRLQEAFENLFKNAVVHAGEDVEMRVEADDGTVMIADDGPGIPPDKRDVVFEYGHTGGNGTGLGLAIVRSIIEGHDWDISAAESEEGGARFDIDLGR